MWYNIRDKKKEDQGVICDLFYLLYASQRIDVSAMQDKKNLDQQ